MRILNLPVPHGEGEFVLFIHLAEVMMAWTALIVAVLSLGGMTPSSLLVVFVMKKVGESFITSLMWTMAANCIMAAFYFIVFVVGKIPYESWQPAVGIASAVIAALVWNIVAFVAFRR